MSKNGVQEFTSSWSKTVQWAKQSGIPQSSYYPVYQMDSQRMLSTGSGMSEAERIRAIQAAAGLNYSNALPTDVHSDSSVVANVKSNAANIFTGLNPVSLVKNIFDTVTNTVEHPSSVYGIFLTKSAGFNGKELAANMDKYVLQPHSIWSWVPGLADVAELFQGKKGVNNLAQNPLTALLDVLPLGHDIPKVLAETDKGAEIANRLGISKEELAKMSAQQLSWALARKSSKFIDPSKVVAATDAAGQTTLNPMTWGDRMNLWRNKKNVGSEQSHLTQGLIQAEQKGTRLVQALVEPGIEAFGRLSTTDKEVAANVYQTDFRSEAEILNDDSIPLQVRDALEPVFVGAKKLNEVKMQKGQMADVKTRLPGPDGAPVNQVEKYLLKPGSRGDIVNRASKVSDDANDVLDEGSKKFDYLLNQVDDSDRSLDRFIQSLHTTSSAVFQSIKASIPALPDDAAERARAALPAAERWDRTVPAKTVVLRNLLGLGPDERISLHSMNAIRDLMSPGGLLDHVYQAYEDQDFKSMADYAKVAVRKFENKVFSQLPGGPNGHLLQMRNIVKGLEQYSKQRSRLMDTMDRFWNGKGPKDHHSVAYLMTAAQKADQHFIETSIRNPPDVWDSAFLQALTHQIDVSEKTADLIPKVTAELQKQDPDSWDDDAISKLREDPRTIAEIVNRASKDAYGNPTLPDIDPGLINEFRNSAYTELASLRARGMVPHYIPRLSPNEIAEDRTPTYNMKLQALRPKSEAATSERIFDYKSSVFDIQLGLLKGAKEALHDDVLSEFHEQYVKPLLHNGDDLRALLRNYLAPDIATNAVRNLAGTATDSTDALIQAQIKKMGLVTWDPKSVFGNLSMPKMDADHYINADLAKAMQTTVERMDNPANTLFDKGTKVFRTSILGLSPRFTAHIVFGGSFLVGLRAHSDMAGFLRDAVHYGKTGKLHDATLAKYPGIQQRMDEAFGISSSQEGAEAQTFHYLAGKQQGHLVLQEFLSNHPHLEGVTGFVKAAANINFRFTRAVTKAQKAIVYLDGYERAMKGDGFYDDIYTQQFDIHGQPLRNPVTGKAVYQHSREKVDMTSAQAHEAGVQAAMSVMGDMRHMTPLERNVLLKAFPFYGWTKHILSYVLSYPADHPYRAQFLSQLATQNSADVPSGLPTRIQLLFFLGQPDAQGNVSAVDDRFLDPLRDTANYASWTGLFESLNPVISAPLAAIDPSASFGGTPLYPNVTFNSLYGIKTAGAQGNIWNSVEQVVPEVSAIDGALNLSGQYSYLKKNNPGGMAKMLANALNVPFVDVQHINLRQIAAKGEEARFGIAENDAYEAVSTGDFSTLDKYPPGATVPDPLGTGYNVTPAYLKALYDETEKQYNLPPTAVLRPLPQPQL